MMQLKFLHGTMSFKKLLEGSKTCPSISNMHRTTTNTKITVPRENSIATKRLIKEAKMSLAEKNENYWTKPVDENNLYLWRAMIKGPEGTPYHGGNFELKIIFPVDYPFLPPLVQFVTRILHC